MSITSSSEAAFIKRLGIDDADVQEEVATGAQHRVIRFLDRTRKAVRMLKLPLEKIGRSVGEKITSYVTKQSLEEVQRDIEHMKMYFEPYAVLTDVRLSSDAASTGEFALAQDVVNYDHLTLQRVKGSEEIRRQMQDILVRNGDLMREQKLWLDVMGMNVWKILRTMIVDGEPYSDNLVIDKETGNIKILDTGLFTFEKRHRIQYHYQRFNVKQLGFNFDGRS